MFSNVFDSKPSNIPITSISAKETITNTQTFKLPCQTVDNM